MQRFYFENLKKELFFVEDRDFINQIIKVLRSKIGDKFIFFNGKNNLDFIYELKKIEKNKLFFEKVGAEKKESELDFEINLFQALPNKLDKIELISQKATEIGISNIYFFKSKRSQKLFLNDKKIERIKKIIIEATEQSNRNKVPNFEIFDKLDFEKLKNSQNIFLHTKNEKSISLKNFGNKSFEKVNIFIGPEGGFSDEEIQIFEENKFLRIYLGDRILRTETAGITTSFFIIQSR